MVITLIKGTLIHIFKPGQLYPQAFQQHIYKTHDREFARIACRNPGDDKEVNENNSLYHCKCFFASFLHLYLC